MLSPHSRLRNPKKLYQVLPVALSSAWFYCSLNLQYWDNITKEEENVSLRLSILTKRTEIELTHGFKIKNIYILASENEKSIKISAYLCDVGVKFEQAAREKLSNEKN